MKLKELLKTEPDIDKALKKVRDHMKFLAFLKKHTKKAKGM
jgi:hypothetical protein